MLSALLSSCSFMETNSVEQAPCALGSSAALSHLLWPPSSDHWILLFPPLFSWWWKLAFQHSGQLLPDQALRDSASENENIIYQCVFNDSERSICAFVSATLMRMCQLQLNSSMTVLTPDWAEVAMSRRGALTAWIDLLYRDTFSS